MIIKPTKKQHEAYQALDFMDWIRVVFFGGGAGGGKSWTGCEWETKQCLLYPESKWFVGRETLTDLMSSTFITFNKVWRHHQIPQGYYKFNGKYNFIEFYNGSRIDFLDLRFLPSDPLYERYGSLEYTGGWIEEAGQIHFGAFDTLNTRIGRHLNDKYGLVPKMFISANPKKNWLYPMFYKPWKEGRLPKDLAFIQSLVGDNPYNEKQYIENLKKITNKALRERLLYGNWEYDDDPSALFTYEVIQDLFTTKASGEGKYLIGDVARKGSDRMVIGYWEGLQLKHIYIFPYEIKKDTTKSSSKIKEIAEQKGVRVSNILLDEDGVGGGCVDILHCKGFINNSSQIEPEQAKYDTSKKLNYLNLKSQCYFMLADKAEKGEIGINCDDPATKDLIVQELEQIKEKDMDKDNKKAVIGKEEIKEAIGRSPDFADMLMMRMYFELNNSEPRVRFV